MRVGDTQHGPLWQRFIWQTEGQDLVEYALLAGVIALGVATVMSGVKTALTGQFTTISTRVATGS